MHTHRLVVLSVIVATSGCASMEAMPSSMAWADGDMGGESGGYSEVAATEAVAERGFFDFEDDAVASKQAEPPPPPSPRAQPLAPGEPPPEEKAFEAAKRLIIYTGSLAVMVPQLDVAIDAFIAHVNVGGGYLQSRSASSITVRVPAERFFATVDWARKNGTVTDEQINAADVTKRVFDLELRLQTAEEARKRLLKLMESATVMADILAIEAQLRRLTDEIEGMKGELRNLGDQIAFSTLTVNFFADAPSPTPYPRRTRSRFPWINAVGIERVLSNF